jgi:hypothetical protein
MSLTTASTTAGESQYAASYRVSLNWIQEKVAPLWLALPGLQLVLTVALRLVFPLSVVRGRASWCHAVAALACANGWIRCPGTRFRPIFIWCDLCCRAVSDNRSTCV